MKLRNKIFSLLLIPIILCVFCILSHAQKVATVQRIKDGDTYVLRAGTIEFTVRMKNIDAPEKSQIGGLSSLLFVDSLLKNKNVEYDSIGIDRYGRTLATLKLDGKRVDSIIVINGWAWQYVAYNKETLLATLMQQAIANRAGLWKCRQADICPPWLYRQFNAKNKLKYCNKCR